ncbi:unnamed protein product [Spirodela intermedia]|uniref:Ribosomal protein eL8/eL30/eS12/Gadd45 domain-containing protein n=1 Tax=Spirodela intermedia TaxID=51605 RepID=A0A7I8KM92_SPIIN|nr:unnamed protein product [Spirodela intermedia]
MGRKNRGESKRPPSTTLAAACHDGQEQSRAECVQGKKLTEMLQMIGREVELERLSKGGIPDKIWTKQQFAIGINDVTRVLERMSRKEKGLQAEKDSAAIHHRPSPLVSLQAVLVASDCTPRYLTHHIPTLANSLGVPVVPVRDYGGGSLRLGELVKLKTAMAVGVKARGSRINKAMEEFLRCEGWWVSHS